MKRRATSQLTREGNYEEVQHDECVDVEVSTPAEISRRKIYRAKRPAMAEVDSTKKGFKLSVPLLTKDLEHSLLVKPPTVDFSAFNEEIKEASPDKKPKPVSGFKSAGFGDLIADINKKQTEQVEAAFLTSATPRSKQSPAVNFPSQASSQPPKLYQLVASFECSVSLNKSDKGKGRLEFMTNLADNKAVALAVFRNSIGSLLYQGYLSKTASITEASDVTVEREADSGDIEYSLQTYRMTDKITKDEIRICVSPQHYEGLQTTLKQVREALSK
jgi:hypothetical protein